MKVRNTPLPASWLKNATPAPLPPSGLGADSRRAMPMTSGNSAVTASSRRLRRRSRTRRSSEPKNLAADIEPLTGQADEQVLQARRGDREAADADPGVHELGADLLGRGVAEHGRGLGHVGL